MQFPPSLTAADLAAFPALRSLQRAAEPLTKAVITDDVLLESARLSTCAESTMVPGDTRLAAIRLHAHVLAEDAFGDGAGAASAAKVARILPMLQEIEERLSGIERHMRADAVRRINAHVAPTGAEWRVVEHIFDIDVGIELPTLNSKAAFMALTEPQLRGHLRRYTGETFADVDRATLCELLLAEIGVPTSLFEVPIQAEPVTPQRPAEQRLCPPSPSSRAESPLLTPVEEFDEDGVSDERAEELFSEDEDEDEDALAVE